MCYSDPRGNLNVLCNKMVWSIFRDLHSGHVQRCPLFGSYLENKRDKVLSYGLDYHRQKWVMAWQIAKTHAMNNNNNLLKIFQFWPLKLEIHFEEKMSIRSSLSLAKDSGMHIGKKPIPIFGSKVKRKKLNWLNLK